MYACAPSPLRMVRGGTPLLPLATGLEPAFQPCSHTIILNAFVSGGLGEGEVRNAEVLLRLFSNNRNLLDDPKLHHLAFWSV